VLISTKGIQGRREPRRTPLDAPSACITGGRDRPSWTTLFTTLLTQAPGDFGEWQGRAVLTGPLTPDTFRILLQEYEWYRADFQAEEAGENIRGARRIVYADVVPIGGARRTQCALYVCECAVLPRPGVHGTTHRMMYV
jgi:hypothetical protein